MGETEIGKKAFGKIENISERFRQFEEKYPVAADDLKSFLNIASILPIGKAGQIAAKGVKGALKAKSVFKNPFF